MVLLTACNSVTPRVDSDFANPTSKKDGIVTGQEVDRTPALTGKTSTTLLEYAATLKRPEPVS